MSEIYEAIKEFYFGIPPKSHSNDNNNGINDKLW